MTGNVAPGSPELWKTQLDAAATNVRIVCLDAIEKAGSGHPGVALGCAELGVYLFSRVLTVNPDDPNWIDRDRFVLSCGHGSILLYTLLHLSGFDISVDDLTAFRQSGSRTPGHPEYGVTPGVDVTTGPLGQGISAAVGMALAERMLAARLNTRDYEAIDHYTYVIASDGDLMEGVTYEACSLAGQLGLGKLIVVYDSNRVTIDGPLSLSFSEDVAGRFRACGWHVAEFNGYDFDELEEKIAEAKNEDARPSLLIMDSILGKGSPAFADSHRAHGGVFGPEEVSRIKSLNGYRADESFVIRPSTHIPFQEAVERNRREYDRRQSVLDRLLAAHPEKRTFLSGRASAPEIPALAPDMKKKMSTRVASGHIVRALMELDPALVGGSADLTTPCLGSDDGNRDVTRNDFSGNYIRFGVREHAMASAANGIALHGGLRVFCSTFLAFSDYLRPALRLSAVMKAAVVYVLTHDSLLIGQDGPTHQPVEHLDAIRAIPGVRVIRPADYEETEEAWNVAYGELSGPCVLVLARQDVSGFTKPAGWEDDFAKYGAYVVRDGGRQPILSVLASGSEVSAALDAIDMMGRSDIRVLSVADRERFFACPDDIIARLAPPDVRRLVIEAGRSRGWGPAFGPISAISIEDFGFSAPGEIIAAQLGLDARGISSRIRELITCGDDYRTRTSERNRT